MNSLDWIDAQTACAMLGVKPQTLYAYVSPGRVRARADAAEAAPQPLCAPGCGCPAATEPASPRPCGDCRTGDQMGRARAFHCHFRGARRHALAARPVDRTLR